MKQMNMSNHEHQMLGDESVDIHAAHDHDCHHHDMNMDMDHHDHHVEMPEHAHTGHHDHHMSMMRDMKCRFIVVIVLMIPLLPIVHIMSFEPIIKLDNLTMNLASLILGSLIFFYGGWSFFKGAIRELRAKKPAMMMLISLGISVAYLYSAAMAIADITGFEITRMNFWFELSTLIAIMLFGHIVEMRATMSAGDALKSLAELLPKMVHRLRPGARLASETDDVSISDIREGDILFVRENEKIPADGVIISDVKIGDYVATVDESMITGESRAVKKYANNSDDSRAVVANSSVFAGSLNQNLPFKMRVSNTGKKSYLNQVAKLVADAQNQKSRAENLADRVAGWLFYFALAFAVIAFVYWSLYSGANMALTAVVATLVVACPHALGLAIPLVSARLMTIAAKNGLLIQNKTSLENVAKIRFALLDKTGTLTDGKFAVRAFEAFSRKKILPIFASLENGSTHPIAVAIRDYYQKSFPAKNDKNPRKLLVAEQKKYVASQVENLPGIGVRGVISRENYVVVSEKFLRDNDVNIPVKHQRSVANYRDDGLTLAFLIRETSGEPQKSDEKYTVLGCVALGDAIKPGAKNFIKNLRKSGVEPIMLTGDNKSSAEKVAKKLSIRDFRTELKPDEKSVAVREYQRRGKVLFVGDGVNDSPALAASDLSFAIGAGTSIAIASADVVLVNSNLADVLKLLEIARKSNRKIRENLLWGAGYNLLSVPLAAFGFLSPIFAGILMSVSTVIVAINASTLRDKKSA